MNIIIEGVDKVGKTTICQLLLEIYKDKLEYIKFPSDNIRDSILDSSLSNKNKAELCLEEMENFVDDMERDYNYIIDRFWISTLIYQGNEEEIREYILERIDEGILKDLDVKYLFFIKSNHYFRGLNEDLYERRRNYYIDQYNNIFNNEIDLLNIYFDKTIIINNERNKIEKSINKMVDILSPDLI